MSLKALAEKVLQRNGKGNLTETPSFHDGNFEGEKFPCKNPEHCLETETVAEPSKRGAGHLRGSLHAEERRTGEIEPALPCPNCGAFAWWLSIREALVCGVCHPPASPALVRRWIGDPETLTRMKTARPGVLLSLDEIRARKHTK